MQTLYITKDNKQYKVEAAFIATIDDAYIYKSNNKYLVFDKYGKGLSHPELSMHLGHYDIRACFSRNGKHFMVRVENKCLNTNGEYVFAKTVIMPGDMAITESSFWRFAAENNVIETFDGVTKLEPEERYYVKFKSYNQDSEIKELIGNFVSVNPDVIKFNNTICGRGASSSIVIMRKQVSIQNIQKL